MLEENLKDVKKELGPEMKSTGEAIRFVENLKDPFFREGLFLYDEKKYVFFGPRKPFSIRKRTFGRSIRNVNLSCPMLKHLFVVVFFFNWEECVV